MIRSKPCKKCGSIWHTPMFHNERKPLPKPQRRIRREAPKSRAKRLATAEEWHKLNPGTSWPCYLQIADDCLKVVTDKTLYLEHTLSKTRHPEYKYDATKLKAACSPCNALKGSRDYIEGRLV